MSGAGAPAVYTIPPGVPFLDALAAGIRAEAGDGAEALAAVTVLLPTRRAGRALADAFLRLAAGRPMLLPRVVPLGDVDEDALALSGDPDDGAGGGAELPPAIPPLRRQLLLARLVMADPGRHATWDQAARLAAELARLLDQVHTERLGFGALAGLVPDEYAEHWQTTLRFLAIVTDKWPQVLAAEGCLDPADRRNRLLAAQAEAWRRTPPAGPVYAAGSTGSIPATADLLGVVARLPRSRVVLPGLDRDADDATWDALDATHPQHGMKRLLERLGIGRADVRDWPAVPGFNPGIRPVAPKARAEAIRRALRPAAATGAWRTLAPLPDDALRGVSRVDCPGAEEEAGVIALVLRHALEVPGHTAALVTPDRALARRVAAEMGRWGVALDDSAGRPLAQTPPGAFLRLVVRAAAEALAPVPLLALAKHPLAAGGLPPARFRRRVRALETAALRGPRPGPGIDGLRAAASDRFDDVLDPLERALAPLGRLLAGAAPLGALVAAHTAAAEALAAAADETGAARLWAGEAGQAAASFVAELDEAAGGLPAVPGAAYPALFEALMEARVVRPRWGLHPRLAVWGPLEARMMHADVMVLGGLNEGTWPPPAEAGPWMSRPMMAAFGLPAPERRIGLAAHDFAEGVSAAPTVVLTRAAKVDGTPTVPSRWLLRLDALLRLSEAHEALAGEDDWLHWRSLLDDAEPDRGVHRPAPRPPVAARPRQLPVTQVEAWMRNPYAIYARHVLRLKALDPLDADPGAADYGSFIHGALDAFVAQHPGAMPADALDRLLALGRESFGAFLDRPGVWAFWWPRFERVAAWFVALETDRRTAIRSSATEAKGRLVLDAPAGPFTLTAVADRIDVLADGTLAIVDYKTGTVPTRTEVAAGFSPQLPLEAAIAAAGGFEGVPRGKVSRLEFWRLGGGDPAGEIKPAGDDAGALGAEARAGLAALVATFDRPDTPYEARPRPEFAPRFDDYEHLARVKEWSAGREGGE